LSHTFIPLSTCENNKDVSDIFDFEKHDKNDSDMLFLHIIRATFPELLIRTDVKTVFPSFTNRLQQKAKKTLESKIGVVFCTNVCIIFARKKAPCVSYVLFYGILSL